MARPKNDRMIRAGIARGRRRPINIEFNDIDCLVVIEGKEAKQWYETTKPKDWAPVPEGWSPRG